MGCHAKNEDSKPNSNNVSSKKPKITFKPGIPSNLKGTYYRADISQTATGNDTFLTLTISDNSLRLKKSDADDYEIDFSKASHIKVSDNAYLVKSDDQYIKVVASPDQKLNISKDISNDKAEANANRYLQTFTEAKPSGYFGIETSKLYNRNYISDWDALKYYSFSNLPIGNNLMQVDQQGIHHLIKSYGILESKLTGYILTNTYEDAETLLLPISETQLKDAKTGETFTRYPQSYDQLKQAIRQYLGLESEQTVIPEKPSHKHKETKDEKTFDFADDKDDDYYDTYDDFDLNNGD